MRKRSKRDLEIQAIVVKETTRLPQTECPWCHRKIDCASSEEQALPSPGDVTVCLYCGALLEFDAGMIPRSMSPEALETWQRTSPNTYQQALEYQRKFRKAIATAYLGPKPDSGPLQ